MTTCIQLLLKYGADANAKLGSGRFTALHFAAEEGHLECVQVLLDAGALIDVTNAKYQTPLHLGNKKSNLIKSIYNKRVYLF